MFDVDCFINAVKARPSLYDSTHQNYKRKNIKAQLWDEVGRIMYPSEWSSLDDSEKIERASQLQKRWKSLKDCFNREVRAQKTQNTNTVRKKYEFYDKLSFLLPKDRPESPESVDYLKPVRIQLAELPPDTTLEAYIPPECVSGPTKRKVNMDDLLKPKQFKVAPDTIDSDRLFLLSFINDMKLLPLATKYWVKMKFSEIMHQAAMAVDEFQERRDGYLKKMVLETGAETSEELHTTAIKSYKLKLKKESGEEEPGTSKP